MLFSVKTIASKYNFVPKGIIHLGAHIGQEAEDCSSVKNVLWIEGNPAIIPELEKNIEKYEGNIAYQALVSDVDGQKIDPKGVTTAIKVAQKTGMKLKIAGNKPITTKLFMILKNANKMTISPAVLKKIPDLELF